MNDARDTIDLHTTITDKIVEAIEAGAGRFIMPWHRSGAATLAPSNIETGRAYQGVNILALWVASDTNGFTSGRWGTYRQWQAAGAQVCRGQKATTILFYKRLEHDAPAESGGAGQGATDKARFVARASKVFAAEQTDGYVPEELPPAPAEPMRLIGKAEAFISATEARIGHGGTSAYYSPGSDTITLPPKHLFRASPTSSDAENYYATAFHELGHWTGHRARLARDFGKRFGDLAYGAEELVAELTAAFLCAALQVSNSPRADHAHYVSAWLKLMKSDTRAIFVAASKANEAVRFLRERVDVKLAGSAPVAN